MYASIVSHRSLASACLVTLFVVTACTDGNDTTTTGPTPVESSSLSRHSDEGEVGGVFVTTNGADGNAIVAFSRAADGRLTRGGTFQTGGRGTGGAIDPLQSQAALALSGDNRRLYVVNAGSNSIATFAVDRSRLSLLGTTPSGGSFPVSVAASQERLFVLNAGSNDIAEFSLRGDGTPRVLSVVTAHLGTPASGASTIGVSPDGRFVVVTERDANTIDVFRVAPNGALSTPVTAHSSGNVPFGFDFTPRGRMIVSEAAGAAPNGAVSSYALNDNASLAPLSRSISTQQAATCWLVVSQDGRFAFAVNSASGSISALALRADGSLQLVDADGRTAVTGSGSAPIDLGLTRNGRFLYVLNAGAGTIGGFAVGLNGSLSALGDTPGLTPASGLQGLAAY